MSRCSRRVEETDVKKQTVLLVLLVLSVAGLFGANLPSRTVTVEYREFTGLETMDGNWSALYAASDGKVYVGLCNHGGDGHLAYYDPKTDRMHDGGNLTEAAGEALRRLGPQSKIHAKFGEGKDGRIYFGTQRGWWFNWARLGTKEGYPGFHWMAFDPKTNRIEDFGLGGLRDQSINTGAYDPLFNRIYGMASPRGHFVYYDVAKRKSVDKGRVSNWDSICRTLGIDREGNVYGSFGIGQVFKYDPRTDEIRELSVHIPLRQKGISLGRDYGKSETAWRVVAWDDKTSRFYGLDESAGLLFSFDPKAGKEGEVRQLGQMCAPGFENRRDIPFTNLGFALGRDRKLYYAASDHEFDHFNTPKWGNVYLITYNIDTGKMENLGAMVSKDGRRVYGMTAGDTGPDGTVYFVGVVEVKPQPGRPMVSGGKIDNIDYRLALVFYKPK